MIFTKLNPSKPLIVLRISNSSQLMSLEETLRTLWLTSFKGTISKLLSSRTRSSNKRRTKGKPLISKIRSIQSLPKRDLRKVGGGLKLLTKTTRMLFYQNLKSIKNQNLTTQTTLFRSSLQKCSKGTPSLIQECSKPRVKIK